MQYREETDKPDKIGAIVYAVMFAVYISAMVTLSIVGVPYIYFFAILIAGIPVSGVTLSLLQGASWLKTQNNKHAESVNTDAVDDNSEYTDAAGRPVIRL